MNDGPNRQIIKKLDTLTTEIKDLRKDVKTIYKQLPNNESLQTKSECKSKSTFIYLVFSGIGAAFLGIIGWLFTIHNKMGTVLEKIALIKNELN